MFVNLNPNIADAALPKLPGQKKPRTQTGAAAETKSGTAGVKRSGSGRSSNAELYEEQQEAQMQQSELSSDGLVQRRQVRVKFDQTVSTSLVRM